MSGERRRPLAPIRRRHLGVGLGVASCIAALVGCTDRDVGAVAGADGPRSGSASMDEVRFDDVADEVGLDFRHGAFAWAAGPDAAAMMGGGICWIDVDRDGWLDLYAVNTWSQDEWGEWRREGAIPTSRLYRNDRGRFVDVTDEMGAAVENRGMGCVAADLDQDGWVDLLVTTERDDVVLWNDRGERFIDDATSEHPSGLATYGWHAGATVGDVNGDGRPDVFVAGYTDTNRPNPDAASGFPNTFRPEPDLLFVSDGPVGGARARFREVAVAAGIEPDGAEYGLGAVLSDLDRDGDLDLYVANDTTPNQLYENVRVGPDGVPVFVEIGAAAGVDDRGAGMGVAIGDLDGDERDDLATTNQLDERHLLVRGSSVDAGLRFDDARSAWGVDDFGRRLTGWGVTFVDVDLDGDRDVAMANGAIPVRDVDDDREPLVLYESVIGSSATTMRDVSIEVGLDALGPRLGRGLAAADYDNDGDLDLAVGAIGGDLTLLRNTGAQGHWLAVALPTSAYGASVTVRTGDLVQRRELVPGGSYLSTEDPRAHFGLGAATEVTEVVVRLLDGRTTVLRDVDVDQLLEIDPADAR